MYKAIGRRLYVAVAPDSWKAKHVAANGRVAVTVPVRRGGLLSLLTPIPPATISFHAAATVHPAESPQVRSAWKELASVVPAERRTSASITLRKMLDPAAAQARVPVSREGRAR